MTDQTPPRRALAVMAHPDDIEFMCGGLMARLAREGVELHYCLLTDGSSGSRDPNMDPAELVAMRRREQEAAGAIIGVAGYTYLGHTDGRLVASIELRLEIARVIRQVRPQIVITSDPRFFYSENYTNHPDHRAAGEATLAAIMPTANTLLAAPELRVEGLEPHDVEDVYLTTAAQPNHYVPLEPADLERKVAMMTAHVSQVSQFPGFEQRMREGFARSAEQARANGVECDAAEAFTLIRLRRRPPTPEPQK